MKTNEQEFNDFLNSYREEIEKYSLDREKKLIYRQLLLAWLASNFNKKGIEV